MTSVPDKNDTKEVSEEESPNLVKENETTQTTGQEEQRVGTWMELMGKDLQMKVVEVDESSRELVQGCEVGDAVVVDFVGLCASNDDKDEWEEGPIFHDAKEWLVIVGDKDVPPALEMAIRFLHVGEKAVIISKSKYAFGPFGRQHGDYELPPSSSVIYHVHIKSVIPLGTERFSTPEFQIECALNKKKIGNDCYQNEWAGGYGKTKAILLYNKGAQNITNLMDETNDTEIQERAREVLVDCLNNVAAVHMRAKSYGKAKEAATQVILHDPENLKGLCRAARASMLDPASTYEESDAAIAAAEQVNADDADVIKLRAELKRRKHEYKMKSKAMYSKMVKDTQPASAPTEEKENSVSGNLPEQSPETSPREGDTASNTSAEESKPKYEWTKYLAIVVTRAIVFALAYYCASRMTERLAEEENDHGGATVERVEQLDQEF